MKDETEYCHRCNGILINRFGDIVLCKCDMEQIYPKGRYEYTKKIENIFKKIKQKELEIQILEDFEEKLNEEMENI